MVPLVSIIIPTYNRGQLIGETLDSVAAQTYVNWECIIVDDGSTDDSQTVIEQYCKRDPRFKFYQRPALKPKGASSCRNYGFAKSKGDLIQFLDSDDLLDKDKLNEQLSIYTLDDNFTIFTCKWGWFRTSSEVNNRFKHNYNSYKSFKIPSRLLETFGHFNEYLPLHNYLVPRELIVNAGGWNESLSNNDDAEFYTRVILNAKKIQFVENAKVYYRFSNKDKLSGLNTEEKAISAINSWELIDSYSSMDPKKSFKIYIKQALFNLYETLNKNFPELVLKHQELFAKRKDYDTPYYRFIKKIKWRLKTN